MPGLAHFCEHLLFMVCTSQMSNFHLKSSFGHYREQNLFLVKTNIQRYLTTGLLWVLLNKSFQFLAKNNGGSNAYTGTSNTNYYFNVATPALSEALARFAAFFHCPLFAPSCTSRELNAVNSEHRKNHQADLWRIFQLTKHLSIPGHPWRKFGSGNRESLSQAAQELKAQGKLPPSESTVGSTTVSNGSLAPSPIPSRLSSPAPSVASADSEAEADGGAVGRETRRRLVEWWEQEYCANRMRLCVIGKGTHSAVHMLSQTQTLCL